MVNDPQGSEFLFQIARQADKVIIFLERAEVLSVAFNAENLAHGLFERIKNDRFLHLSDEQRGRVYKQVFETLLKEGREINEETVRELEEQAVQKLELQLLKESVEVAIKEVSEKFDEVVIAFWEKLLNLATFAGANDLRDRLNIPEQKYSAKVIEESLRRLDRERVRALVGEIPSRGGARNVKHPWTDEERACLAAKYEELQPIWIEAKRIAKDAQKSKERTRQKEWRKEVLRAYPQLPDDLLERFANPRSEDAKPADIAVIHAKRECGVVDEYTPRHLRDQIRAWKLKAPT